MTVKIAHASGGGPHAAGDQTGREVCVRDWWSGGWTLLLRPKNPDVAEKLAAFAERAAVNENIGYYQGDRNSLRDAARRVGWKAELITTPCNTDCSAFASVCAEAAGVDVPYTRLASGGYNAPVTWTMRSMFGLTGQFERLEDAKYLLSSAYLKRGDILVSEPQSTGHAIVVISNGANVPEGGGGSASQPVESSHKTHTVVWGDTLWGIAQKYGTTVDAICKLNELDPAKFIYPGQVIVIPK